MRIQPRTSEHTGTGQRPVLDPLPIHLVDLCCGKVRESLLRGEMQPAISAVETAFRDAGRLQQFDESTPITSLGVSIRVCYVLDRAGIRNILALQALRMEELRAMLDDRDVAAVLTALRAIGRELKA